MEKRYVFVKDWKTSEGVIQTGREVSITHGCVYLDGGMMSPYYANVLMSLITNEEKNGFNYLKPMQVIYNKC